MQFILCSFSIQQKLLVDSFRCKRSDICFMLQFIRFLRRTEGVEAARKYFLDARKSPSCTYHVYVAYATMAFCLDKDPKVLPIYLFFFCLYFSRYIFYKIMCFIIIIQLDVCLEFFFNKKKKMVDCVDLHACLCTCFRCV